MTAPRGLADRSHDELVVLVRELLLGGHLIDRAGMPLLLSFASVEQMRDVAIDEWRGASPVYTRRMQRLLGFEGDDVATIFKGMQLDIGAPPQFLDFRYRVADHDHGEFWLDHCGALMDVEPMGEEMVHTMCHAIEDPTFPATACATNPRASVTPLHRPPRTPADRHPHCHWTVQIDPEAELWQEPEQAVRVAGTEAARLPLAAIDPAVADGRLDYSGPLVDDVPLAELSSSALVAVAEEVALQGQLLVLSFLSVVGDRFGADRATDLGRRQLGGVGAVVAGRLRAALGVADDLAGLAEVLSVHPALRPSTYVEVTIEPDVAGDRLVVALRGGPALRETVAPSWPMLLDTAPAGTPSPFEVLCQGACPRARCASVPVVEGEHARWEVVLADEPAVEPDEVVLTRFSTGVTFQFQDR